MFDPKVRLRINKILEEKFDEKNNRLIVEVEAYSAQIGFFGETEWHGLSTQKYALFFNGYGGVSEYKDAGNPDISNQLEELYEKYFPKNKENNDK